MRKIGIRQFQQNFHKEMKNLPFTVTKNGEDYCVVTSPGIFISTPLPASLPEIDVVVTSAGTRPDQATESVIRKSNVTTKKVDLEELGIKPGKNVVTFPQPPQEPVNKSDQVATYTVSKKPLEGLKPLPEDGTYLAVEGIPHNKPKVLQDDVTTQDARPTGKCQIPNGICRNLGYKYHASLYDSEGEVIKEVFLCDLHVRKMREGNVEVVEI